MEPNDLDLDAFRESVRFRWPLAPSAKARPYVNAFFDTERRGTRIIGKVVGNHGTYTVSIHGSAPNLPSACSCYIGKYGYCHHCEALACTFLNDPGLFREIQLKQPQRLPNLTDVGSYLEGVTLDSLLVELKSKGMSQKAFAETIGMSTRHLSTIKSSELRNRYFHELGATKLACLWFLEHLGKTAK
jgi:uncharacterized Zn finger protein